MLCLGCIVYLLDSQVILHTGSKQPWQPFDSADWVQVIPTKNPKWPFLSSVQRRTRHWRTASKELTTRILQCPARPSAGSTESSDSCHEFDKGELWVRVVTLVCAPSGLGWTWWWCTASCPRMSVDILGTNCDHCQSMVQCCFTSTETARLIKTESPGRPPRLSHSSSTLIGLKKCRPVHNRSMVKTDQNLHRLLPSDWAEGAEKASLHMQPSEHTTQQSNQDWRLESRPLVE